MPKKDINPQLKLSDKSAAFLDMLTDRGFVEDKSIKDEKIRKSEKEKKRKMFHNTSLMLQHYRNIAWMLECFPENIAEELDKPLRDLDALISAVNDEIGFDNRRMENRMKSVNKSRMLLDRVNEALTVLKQKPVDGQLMYDIIYNTYIIPEKLTHMQLIYRINISTRHYYRLRNQAINVLSLRLWAAPAGELDSWIDILSILENI